MRKSLRIHVKLLVLRVVKYGSYGGATGIGKYYKC